MGKGKKTKTETVDIELEMLNDPSITPEIIGAYNKAKHEYPTLTIYDPFYIKNNVIIVKKELELHVLRIELKINEDELTDEAIEAIRNNSFIEYLRIATDTFSKRK